MFFKSNLSNIMPEMKYGVATVVFFVCIAYSASARIVLNPVVGYWFYKDKHDVHNKKDKVIKIVLTLCNWIHRVGL